MLLSELEESTKPWVTMETMRRQAQSSLSSASSSSSGSSRSSSSSSSPSPASSPSPTKAGYFPSADLDSSCSRNRAVPRRVPPYEAARMCSRLLANPASSVEDVQGTIPARPGIYNLIDGETNEVLFCGVCPSLLRNLQRHIWPTGLDKFLVDLQVSGKLDCLSVRVTHSSLPKKGLSSKELMRHLRNKFAISPILLEPEPAV